MSDGREEREEGEWRRQREEQDRRNLEDRLEQHPKDEWEPERTDS